MRFIFILLLALTGCSSMPKAPQTLTVFAAASLNDAFREVGAAFEKAHPGTAIQFNFSGSQELSTQLQAGAQADVFASANMEEMGHLIDARLVAADASLVFVHNKLVVILPPDNPVDVLSEPYDVSAAVNFARQLYETIIIDSPGPYEDWGLNHARLADTLLLVTTNELPALHCTQRALAYLTRHGISRAKIGLLVNRYNPDVGLGREAIETALRTEVLHVVPSDYPAVHKSMMEGKPLAPGSKLAKSIEELARLLVGPNLTPPEPLPKKTSLFSSLFARPSNGSAGHPTG